MTVKATSTACTIVIFGASGDLTKRKLIPALHSLDCEDLLPQDLQIIGLGRTELTNAEFRDQLKEGVEEYGRLKPEVWKDFAGRLSYLTGSYTDEQSYSRLQEKCGDNILFYLAVPPSVFPTITAHLGSSGLNRSPQGWRRIIIEKPFGEDLQSARNLNEEIHKVFNEEQVYRIDHYLGKETVQNILSLRFANAIFEPLWNLKYVDHIQMTVAEEDGIGYRGEYYDDAGILRDIFQNHLLQLLTLTAMEPPVIWEADALRDEKVKVLQAVRPIKGSIRGQYGGSENINAYRQEEEVPDDSDTATFAVLRLFVDNWRWRGVPFYLRSGKRLKTKSTWITIQFKEIPHLLFPHSENEDQMANTLSLCIQPNEGIQLGIQGKEPGAGMQTRPVDIDYQYAQDFSAKGLPAAYERLLLDAIEGDASLFARADEIELAWKIIDPVIASWKKTGAPALHTYWPHTWGPPEAGEFIQHDGRHWITHCVQE